MTKIYIVWASWDEHGPIVTEDCGIFTNKKSADDKLNKINCLSDGVDKKEGEYLFDADYCWVSEYELNDQGEYKFVKVEGETE